MTLDASLSDLEHALEEFDTRHRGTDEWTEWTDNGNHKYAIRHDGKLYPVKMVVSLATGRRRNTFHGGRQANSFVESHGFEIVELDELDGEFTRTSQFDGGSNLRASFEELMQKAERLEPGDVIGSDTPVWKAAEKLRDAISNSLGLEDDPHAIVQESVGKGKFPKVPWLGIFDGRETTTAKKGIYPVYLFRRDMSGFYLSLTQGVTHLEEEHGLKTAVQQAQSRAEEFRTKHPRLVSAGFRDSAVSGERMDLRSDGDNARLYENADIGHRFYSRESLPSDEELRNDLSSLLEVYRAYVEDRSPEITQVALSDVVSDFGQKLDAANISFGTRHEETVRTFVTSLATKGFVILTGVSGSGKTQIAKQFGKWLGDEQSRLIAVRPDWTGAESLFGYPDALLPNDGERRAWHVPEALEFMLQARDAPDQPHLLILDEMNLAHVERYFADVLSGMESNEPCLPNLQEDDEGYYRVPKDEPSRVPFPDNLFVVGTVNVDETTYMFSPKVLDRANTLEFKVDTEDLRVRYPAPEECEQGSPRLRRGFLEVARDEDWHVENPHADQERFANHLRSIHRLVDGTGFEFAHRTFHEALRFAALYDDAGGRGMREALDVQLLQKILPRMHGSRRKLEPVLSRLGEFCFELPQEVEEPTTLNQEFDPVQHDSQEAALPRSFGKIRRMMRNLRANQFTSFTE